MLKKYLIIILIFYLVSIRPILATSGYEQGYKQIIEENKGIYLNYHDLVYLSETKLPKGEVLEKLRRQLNPPIIHQPPQGQAKFLHGDTLGDFFRVVSWNIERGFNVDLIEKLFNSTPQNISLELQSELNILSKANIIALHEVDIGVPRTNYENIRERLAKTLKMGYVFATEFVEVDPYQLGIKKFTKEERTFLEPKALEQLDNINKEKYHGLHGSLILSKYPIVSAKVIRLPICYNWYQEELAKLSGLELTKRGVAKTIFATKVLTELRHGSRIAIVVNLLLPNKEEVTIVSTHLENRCIPKCRAKQFEFILNNIKDIRNPLILVGDFNTTGLDASPVSIKKEVLKKVKDPEFIAKQAILSLTPFTLVQNVVLNTVNLFRKFKDPTTKDIPVILPNKERKIFVLLREFKFNDGNTFDVRGTPEKSHKGYYALLSNSNERELKGYKPTFELERDFGIAKYKLDWFFVKPLTLKDPNDKKGSYAYAPHFGRTLRLANRAFGKEISDHDPITVDIPVREPK